MAGIYVHIPFCMSRCIYCDFFSTTRISIVDQYVDALTAESSRRCDSFHSISSPPYDTLYIGGGTPSVMRLSQVERLMSSLTHDYPLKKDAEITIECNPEDVDKDYIYGLRSIGFNRLSLGVQTFDDNRLNLLCRRHNSFKAIKAVEDSRSAGFDNISIDLIYGFPDETLESWEEDVIQALSLGISHISAYSLMLESGTRLTKMIDDGKLMAASEEDSLRMYETLVNQLTSHGFLHYEISNFCKPGCSSRHNQSYWHGVPYLGLGAGAHSYDGKRIRRWNVSDLDKYLQKEDYFESEELSDRDLYNEYVMTRLRTSYGINLSEMKEVFSNEYTNYFEDGIKKFISNGEIINEDGKVRLSKKGVMLSNAVISDLFSI